MKYSIRGAIYSQSEESVVNVLNKYTLWRLVTDIVTDSNLFIFEAWVSEEDDKNGMYTDLKSLVNQPEEYINWHLCAHDESTGQPCSIVEEYRGG